MINGGVPDLEAARAHLEHVDGVMLGRAAYQNPEMLLGVDPELFGEPAPVADAFEALEAFMTVIAAGLAHGERLHDYTRHLHGLFAGRRGARAFRQVLATEAAGRGAGLETLEAAMARVERAQPGDKKNLPTAAGAASAGARPAREHRSATDSDAPSAEARSP